MENVLHGLSEIVRREFAAAPAAGAAGLLGCSAKMQTLTSPPHERRYERQGTESDDGASHKPGSSDERCCVRCRGRQLGGSPGARVLAPLFAACPHGPA